MLVPVLIGILVILGLAVGYIYYIAPRFNPESRADSYISQNMVDEAIMEYKKILDKNPLNSSVHYKLSQLYFNINEIDKGVIHLEEIVRINKYNFDIDRLTVLKKLAETYIRRHELEKAFQTYLDIVEFYPGDTEALYQVSFIALGQELFEMSQKYFMRLVKQERKSFEVLFGSGISSYMNQKTSESLTFFKEALAIEPHSDVANLAMAFSLQRKKDFKTAVNYLKMITDNSSDETALFIARRLLAIILVQGRKADEGVKILEELLEQARKNDMFEEISVILYDLGFAALKAEKTELAYEYWNMLYQHDRNYKNVQSLTTMLRKEMDLEIRQGGQEIEGSVIEFAEDWIKDSFPENFLWDICGLKENVKIDMRNIIIQSGGVSVPDGSGSSSSHKISFDADEILGQFENLNAENFRITSNRLLVKMGYRVDEILPTYRENDGVDFLAHSIPEKEKTLVWVRRWKDIKVGEIPLRNFAQAINDMKCKHGLFITTTEMTGSGEAAAKRLSKVTVISPEELGSQLMGIM